MSDRTRLENWAISKQSKAESEMAKCEIEIKTKGDFFKKFHDNALATDDVLFMVDSAIENKETLKTHITHAKMRRKENAYLPDEYDMRFKRAIVSLLNEIECI